MVGPKDFMRPNGEWVSSIQFATSLTVQRASPEQWYLHCCFLHAPSDFLWPRAQWPEWFFDYVKAASMALIPQAHAREKVWRDETYSAVIYRTPLEPFEKMLLPPEESVEAFQ